MSNRSHLKYFIAISISVVIFIFSTIGYIVNTNESASVAEYDEVPYRLEFIKDHVEMGGSVSYALSYENDIEPEFDQYWEYSSIETAYIEGCLYARAMADSEGEEYEYYRQCLEERIAKINAYRNETHDSWMEEFAAKYANELELAY